MTIITACFSCRRRDLAHTEPQEGREGYDVDRHMLAYTCPRTGLPEEACAMASALTEEIMKSVRAFG